MLNKIRLAAVAAAMLIAVAFTVEPPSAHAQAQPATPPAPPAAPAAMPAPPAAPPLPAPAAAPAPMATKAPEVIDNPYGLEALWKGGDLVAKTTLAILVIMSMGSWYIIITKMYEQYKMGAQAKDANKKFWKARVGPRGRGHPQEVEPVPLHRRVGSRGHAPSTTGCTRTSTSTTGSRCRSTAPSTTCRAARRTASRSSPPWARRPRSSACSARCGASTTR